MRRARWVAAVVCAALVAVSCGDSGGAGLDDTTTTSAPETSSTEPSTTRGPSTTQRPSTTTTVPPADLAGELVEVSCDADTSTFTVSSVDPVSAARTVVYEANVDALMKPDYAWAAQFPFDCRQRAAFSSDFSKVAVSANELVDGTVTPHVGYIDLETGEFVDLTAMRQGTGFSDEVLSEFNAVFLGTSSPITFGDTIAFSSGIDNSWKAEDPANPGTLTPVPDEVPRLDHQQIRGFNHTQTLIPSPRGDWIASDVGDVDVELWPAGTMATADPITVRCADNVLGWIGDYELVVAPETYYGMPGTGPMLARVTITDGTATCEEFLPPNDRGPADFSLSLDGETVTFSAAGLTGGTSWFEIPVAGGEPVETSSPPPEFPPNTYLFWPVRP